jgi:DNA-binding NarL/FixJ family response regulator
MTDDRSLVPTRVVVAEDELISRDGLARLLQDAGFDVVGLAADARTLLTLVARTRPDIAIIDVRMPATDPTAGLRAAETISARHPATAVLLLSKHIETYHVAALLKHSTAGAGYLLKDRVVDVPSFMVAVRRVAAGGQAVDPEVTARLLGRRRPHNELAQLTDAEHGVLVEMAKGLSNQAIADELHVSKRTVESHVAHIFDKLQMTGSRDVDRRAYVIVQYLRGQ